MGFYCRRRQSSLRILPNVYIMSATPDKRGIDIGLSIRVFSESESPEAIVPLEEYSETTPKKYTGTVHFSSGSQSSILNEVFSSDADGTWSTKWNPGVTFDNCNLVFNKDEPDHPSGEGKCFTDTMEVNEDGASTHKIPFVTGTRRLRFYAFFVKNNTVRANTSNTFNKYAVQASAGQFAIVPMYNTISTSLQAYFLSFAKDGLSKPIFEYIIGTEAL